MTEKKLSPNYYQNIPVYRPKGIPQKILQKFGINGLINLASNENPLGPSPKALLIMQEALKKSFLYPEPLLKKLSKSLSDKLNIPENYLHFGNGIEEILVHLSNAFIHSGDHVVLSNMTFPLYSNNNKFRQANESIVPLDSNFIYDLKAIKKEITTETKLVYLCNSNNPTGTYFTKEALDKFLLSLPEDLIVIYDEAYFEYADAPDYPDGMDYLKKHKNFIITRTFSKFYALAGLRVGYSIQRPKLTECLDHVKSLYSNNFIGEVGAIESLKDQSHTQKTKQMNIEGKAQFLKELNSFDIKIHPTQANFFMIQTSLDALDLSSQLLNQGIIVCPLTTFGIKDAIRVTIGTSKENEFFFQSLKKVLS
ncbi:MAG: histidinol-phosphate transaminase [Candidatus Cloacimonadota bacterium]|nr:MAG: histidinol-phosphate transaminase [Candidatus Cloacimonadota bacterium]